MKKIDYEEQQKAYFDLKYSLISSGREILDLSMINPDIEPSREILDKLVEFSLKPHSNRYAVSRGIRHLREAFSRKYLTAFGVDLSAEKNICVTQGSKDGLLSVFNALFQPGSRVLLPRPFYPGHLAAAELAHLKTDFYDLTPDMDVLYSRIERKISEFNPQAVMLNFPNNPTGIVADESFYTKLSNLAVRRDFVAINDFVYGEMLFGEKNAKSLLAGNSEHRNLLEIYSLSKAYSLAGWRVAAVCGDANLVQNLARFKSRVDYGIFLPIQFAAAWALNTDKQYSQDIKGIYQQRARLISSELFQRGFKVSVPAGGCCVWGELPSTVSGSAFDFCLKLLKEKQIALQPGEFFGLESSRFFRAALVVSDTTLIRLANIISSFANICTNEAPPAGRSY